MEELTIKRSHEAVWMDVGGALESFLIGRCLPERTAVSDHRVKGKPTPP